MRTKSKTLTEQELEIMKVVWAKQTATVRDVYETLLLQRKIAYTTVMTIMKILEKKGYLKKQLRDRAYLYRPTEPQTVVLRKMVREFIRHVFNGSAEPLLAHLVEDRSISEKELQELMRLVRKQS